jgi:uncharacterized membrane protein
VTEIVARRRLSVWAACGRWIRLTGLFAIALAAVAAISMLFPPGPEDADDVAFQVAEFSLLLGFLLVLGIGIWLLRRRADSG